MNRQQRRAAEKAAGKPAGKAPLQSDRFNQALAVYQTGNAAAAEALLHQVLAQQPGHPGAHYLLGLICEQTRRPQRALELLARAAELGAGVAEFHFRYGLALHGRGRLDEAVAAYGRAVALDAKSAEALCNLGVALQALGKTAEAQRRYEQALAVNPDFAIAHANLGGMLGDLGRFEEAAAHFERALAIQPNAPQTLVNYGVVLRRQGRTDEAVARYEQALALNPQAVDALYNLGEAQAARGRADLALHLALRGMQVADSLPMRSLLCECLRYADLAGCDAGMVAALRPLLVRAFDECWVRPMQLAAPALRVLAYPQAVDAWIAGLARLSPDETWRLLAGDALLQRLLKTTPVPNLGFERFLTAARAAMLAAAESPPSGAEAIAAFSALAQQCFIDEYVFALGAAEAARAAQLRDAVAAALAAGAAVPATQLLAVAAYHPLHTLPQASRLLQQDFPPAVAEVVAQQVGEYEEEARLRASIPSITPIADAVSAAVRGQYEENPYPRWIRTPYEAPQESVGGFLRHSFPLAAVAELNEGAGIDLLIAGCGTGQHPAVTARRFPHARILAVDLSLSSLAYAKRKTTGMGIANLEYAQADILELGGIERRFDVIESVGVLHHLADPLAGWRVLLSLLKPGGLMHLGFYSELARQDVVAGRAFIAQRGYGRDAESIRRCRQDMIAARDGQPWARVTTLADFFSASDCRDLLFHVQEHRLSIPQIAGFLAEAGLRFVGFHIDSRTAGAYRQAFPGDPAMNDLENWHRFETAHPGTFGNMYQFWVQKP